ncbi:MAG: hypothetical protein PHC28_05860 [Flavobacterium sp.]|nr:hypothetical protein [Flavobacterium sp.]
MDPISEFLGASTGIDYSKSLIYSEKTSREIKLQVDEVKASNSTEDYTFVRENMRKIITQAMDLIPDAISLARETENSKSFDSASLLLQTLSNINKDLLEINKIDPKGKAQAENITNNTTNNTAIICSPEEVLKRLSSIDPN